MFRALLTLILPVTFLAGQDGPPIPKGPGPKMAMQREQITAHLHRMRMERLQQFLGISEENAKGIADRWTQFDVDNRNHHQRMRQLHQQVNRILLSPVSEEEKNTKIRPLVEQFSALRLQQQGVKRKFEEDICSSLTPAQQGRFILVMEEIQRALMEAIKKQRSENSSQ